jgi:hypothetical protein
MSEMKRGIRVGENARLCFVDESLKKQVLNKTNTKIAFVMCKMS